MRHTGRRCTKDPTSTSDLSASSGETSLSFRGAVQIATRYEKRAVHYLAMLTLAAVSLWL